MQEYYTLAEASEILKTTRQTLYNWIKAGKLNAKKISPKKWLVSAEELKRILGD